MKIVSPDLVYDFIFFHSPHDLLVCFKAVKCDLFLYLDHFDIFGQIGYLFLEYLSLSLKLLNFLIRVNCWIIEFHRIVLLIRNIFFQIITTVLQMKQMMWQVFPLIILKIRSLYNTDGLIYICLYITSSTNKFILTLSRSMHKLIILSNMDEIWVSISIQNLFFVTLIKKNLYL